MKGVLRRAVVSENVLIERYLLASEFAIRTLIIMQMMQN